MRQDYCPREKYNNAFKNYVILARFKVSSQNFSS